MSETKSEETVVETPKVEPKAVEEKPAAKTTAKAEVDADSQQVVYADHPMYWPGVGNLNKGYNLLDAKVAKQWIDQGWVRKASAKEVKEFYGVK